MISKAYVPHNTIWWNREHNNNQFNYPDYLEYPRIVNKNLRTQKMELILHIKTSKIFLKNFSYQTRESVLELGVYSYLGGGAYIISLSKICVLNSWHTKSHLELHCDIPIRRKRRLFRYRIARNNQDKLSKCTSLCQNLLLIQRLNQTWIRI